MFDIHCHLIPGLDDGPATIEDALKMAKTAYDDGTRHLVCTPHMHHPLGFESSTAEFRKAFEKLEKALKELYPDMVIYLGAEVYLSANDFRNDKAPDIKTISDTNYVLVEFDKHSEAKDIAFVLHELQYLGYKPVMAHPEQYRACRDDLELLTVWRKDGILFQCNASSLSKKRHATVRDAVSGMLGMGIIDFIASDGHGHARRKPCLKAAYKQVARDYGKETAERIFNENPGRLLSGGHIGEVTGKFPRKRKPVWQYSAVLALLMCVLTGSVNLTGKRDGEGLNATWLAVETHPEIQTVAELQPAAETESPIETQLTDEALNVIEDEAIPESRVPFNTIAASEDDVADEPDKPITDSNVQPEPPVVSESDSVIIAYTSYLKTLETEYLQEAERYFKEIQAALTIEPEIERQKAISDILDEVGLLESQSDNKVNKALYDMQSDLEDMHADIGIVTEIREHYYIKKEETAERYRLEIQKLYFD